MKNKGGRKGKYHEWIEEDGLKKLEAWARDGLTDEQIAKNIGINIATLYEWKKKYAELNNALKRGKEVVDIEVENALLKRALGMEIMEEKIYIQEVDGVATQRKEIIKKQIPPDTTAMIFWLKNRKPYEWRDKRHQVLEGELDLKGKNPFDELTAEELRKIIKDL